MTENMEAIIDKYFDNLVINPIALHNAFPKLYKKTRIVVSGSVCGPDYYVRYKDYKNPPPHWNSSYAQNIGGKLSYAPSQPHFSTWQYPNDSYLAVRTVLKLSQKEMNKLQDGTIMITFKHPSQTAFPQPQGTILTIGRIRCYDPPSQIHPNRQVEAYRRKRRVKREIKPSEQCCALRMNGTRCRRRKKNGDEKVCGTHIKLQPHGTI